jgi:hypothetical protein
MDNGYAETEIALEIRLGLRVPIEMASNQAQ